MRPSRIALALALTLTLGARHARADATHVLPLRSVRLYETGVGYFQRTGALAAGARPELPVPAAHLDDALQTLVILSSPGSGANVRGVEFASSVSGSMARAMAGLPEADAGTPIGFKDLVLSLKGAEVEVRTNSGITRGRLVDVVAAEVNEVAPPATGPSPGAAAPPTPPPPLTLVVVTDRSEIVRFKAFDVVSVRPTDPAVAARIGSALDALSGQAQKARDLSLFADGTGPVTLGYVAETPVWRTTYRLVEDTSGVSGVLQGWALLHNDTDEEWTDVKVELVNGRPDSFLFPLAAPRYARRELVHPDDELSTVPQLVGRTVDSMWDPLTGAAAGIGLSGVGEGGGGYGRGSGASAIGVGRAYTRDGGATASGDIGSSTVLAVGNLAPTTSAAGVESGALFTYALKDPVHLRARGSLLVPFVQQRVDAELLAWFGEPATPARSGVRVVNATPQTLPAGTIAFFEGGGFAGESALDRLKPGEKRFLLYGADLDVALTTASETSRDEVQRLVLRGDQLEEHFLRTTDVTYSIENRSGAPRAVYLALHLDRNAKVTGVDRVDFDEATSQPLAVFHVAARSTTPEPVTSVEGLVRRRDVRSLDAAALSALATTPTLAREQRRLAEDAAARFREEEQVRRALADVNGAIDATQRDIGRFRADVAAANGARDGVNPFVARLAAAEDHLAALRARAAELSATLDQKAKEVRAALARFTA